MKDPRCKRCRRKVWGNYGDGKWRHISPYGTMLMAVLCGQLPIIPEDS